MSRKRLLFSVLLLLMGITVTTAFADEGLVVRSGEVFTDDIATRDNLLVEAGAVVQGDISLLGSDATISGTIQGDVLVTGGDITLSDSAEIQGDCFVVGGTIANMGANPNIECSVVGAGANIDVSRFTDALSPTLIDNVLGNTNLSSESSERPTFTRSNNGGIVGAILQSVGLSALAFVIALIAPKHINRIGDAITAKPVASGTVGILTFISTVSLGTILAVVSSLLVVVCVGVLGFPLVFALGALLVAALAVGWTAVGTLFGEMIADRLSLNWTSLPLTAGVGTLLLSAAIGLVGWFSWGGFATVIGVLIAVIGLGATTLTKFGSLPYPRMLVDSDKEDFVIRTMPD